jgi:hypothetical protein
VPGATKQSMASIYSRRQLKDSLCHNEYGICVYIIKEDLVLLRSDDSDLERFLVEGKSRTRTFR